MRHAHRTGYWLKTEQKQTVEINISIYRSVSHYLLIYKTDTDWMVGSVYECMYNELSIRMADWQLPSCMISRSHEQPGRTRAGGRAGGRVG